MTKPPNDLLQIGKRLTSASFKLVLEKYDLGAAKRVIDIVIATGGGSKTLNADMKSLDEAILVASYFVSKQRSVHNRSVTHLKRIAAKRDPAIRRALAKTGKVTDKRVEATLLSEAPIEKAQEKVEAALELLGHAEAIRSACYRRHDTLLEISRTERVLLREH
jgi:hypothetical protein